MGKEYAHYPQFSTVKHWLKFLEINSDVFTDIKTWQEIITHGSEIEDKVVQTTLALAGKQKLAQIMQEVTSYLGKQDDPEQSDLIFVFGSKNMSRIQTAVDLWKAKLAPIIHITGNSPYYEHTQKPEAMLFKEYLVNQGVPESSILVENQAITIADNVRRSINLFETQSIRYRKMILVTAWFAMRRSWAFMMKYIPKDHLVFRVNSEVNGNFTQDRWWKNPTGIKTVFNEFVKMRTGIALNTC